VSRDASRVDAVRTLAAEMARDHAPLVLADDTLAAARHAAERGWILRERLPEVGTERARDEGAA
jgi:hypothetical protein